MGSKDSRPGGGGGGGGASVSNAREKETDVKVESRNNVNGMQGTEKQIRYANSIMQEVSENMSLVLPANLRRILKDEVFPSLNESKFWIDNAEKIRSGLMRVIPNQSDREFAKSASQTVNWIFEEAIKKNPSLEKYRRGNK